MDEEVQSALTCKPILPVRGQRALRIERSAYDSHRCDCSLETGRPQASPSGTGALGAGWPDRRLAVDEAVTCNYGAGCSSVGVDALDQSSGGLSRANPGGLFSGLDLGL